jgi:hypothetical protein
MWSLILAACPAERLGVEIPRGGPASISQEDLQRDTWAFSKEPPAEVFARRMAQMHFEISGTCARREGPGRPLVVVAPVPTDADGAAAAAVLVSLAKGWDGATMTREVALCLGDPPEGAAEVVRLAGFGPGDLDWGPPIRAGTPDPARTIEGLDYVALREQVKVIWARLEG